MDTAVAPSPTDISDIELFADSLEPKRAAAIFKQHGCLVVRGLMKPYVPQIMRDVTETVETAISLLPNAKKVPEGWATPDGSLFIPAPEGFARPQQIMVLGLGYKTSAAFFRSAFHEPAVDVVEAILGPDIELFMDGQCLYKEPVGGHPKHLHQDSAYFDHRYEGPVAILNYAVDTDLQNGALHVVPGSHHFGTLKHVDTLSHLGLDEVEWPWERALPINGQAGDSIFFHYRTIHGSKENHSDGPRPAFIHRYRRPGDYVVMSATSVETRADAEKKADEVRKQDQQGLMVRGFRSFEEV